MAKDARRWDQAQLLLVPLSGGVELSVEQASLSQAGYEALGLTPPDDFGRPGAGIQLLLSVADSFALVTIAAVHHGTDASIALADPDRLVSGAPVPPRYRRRRMSSPVGIWRRRQRGQAVLRSSRRTVAALSARPTSRPGFSLPTLACRSTHGSVEVGARSSSVVLHITSDDLSEQSFPGFRALLERPHQVAVSFHGFDVATAPRSNQAVDVIVGGQLDLADATTSRHSSVVRCRPGPLSRSSW